MLGRVYIAAEKLCLGLHESPHDYLELPLDWDLVLELLLNWVLVVGLLLDWSLVVLQESVALADFLELWGLFLAVSSFGDVSSPVCGAPLLAGSDSLNLGLVLG